MMTFQWCSWLSTTNCADQHVWDRQLYFRNTFSAEVLRIVELLFLQDLYFSRLPWRKAYCRTRISRRNVSFIHGLSVECRFTVYVGRNWSSRSWILLLKNCNIAVQSCMYNIGDQSKNSKACANIALLFLSLLLTMTSWSEPRFGLYSLDGASITTQWSDFFIINFNSTSPRIGRV